MKIVSYLLGLVLVLVVAVYTVAFTSFGNSLLQPTIEANIQAQTKLPSKLQTFQLGMSDFNIVLELNKNNTIHLKGNYSLFAQSFDISYSVNLQELKTLKALTQTQLQSSLHTDGTVVGDISFLKVDGKSDVAKSSTTYHIELTDLNPTSIIAKVDTLNLEALLYMLNQKSYASADVNVNVNFKDITPHQLDGEVKLHTIDGKINSAVMKKDFNITIPATAFAMNLDAKLAGDDVNYKYVLNSNLATLSSSGSVVPEQLKTDIIYGVNVKELAVLKPITGADLRGPLRLNGTVKGDKAKLVVDGRSDIADSKTTFVALLKDFTPSSVKAKIQGLRLENALYMVKQPHYADGIFDLDVDITNADANNLQGTVLSTISKGIVDTKFVTKEYKFKSKMPYTVFNAKTLTKLNKNLVDTKVIFNSNLANFDIKQARFDTKNASLVSDYKVTLKDLNKLYFATQRHLKGGIVATGELKKAKDLDFTMHSDIAGGKLDAKLHNDDFSAKLASLQTLDILDILIYPNMFKSKIDGNLKYNLVEEKGTFDGKLSDGAFTKNQVLDLVKQYARINLYKEKFVGDVNAKINKENILASLDLKSNKSSIVAKNTKLNSKTQVIDSKIEINANGNPLSITLKGNANRPKIGVDANKIVKKQAEKAVKKEIKKFFKGLF